MTRHKHAQTGLVTPQLPQQWLTAVLRAFAMLVLNVVSTFQMKQLTLKRDWHTPDDEAALPRVTNDTQSQETKPAAQHRSPIALILSSTLRVRPSKDEGVLTTVSHTAPSPSVSHAARAIYLALPCRWRQDQSNEGELPPSVRSTGGGGLRALARKTEGASSRNRAGLLHTQDPISETHTSQASPARSHAHARQTSSSPSGRQPSPSNTSSGWKSAL